MFEKTKVNPTIFVICLLAMVVVPIAHAVTATGGILNAQITPISGTTGGDMFMSNTLAELGARSNGTFGSNGATVPSGYHPRSDGGRQKLGFRSVDQSVNSWNSPAVTYGDFFEPGDPFEGFGLQVGSTAYWNSNSSTIGIPGTWQSASTASGGATALWKGTVAGVEIKQTVDLPANTYGTRITIAIKNTTRAALTNVYYLRSVDPDNCAAQTIGTRTDQSSWVCWSTADLQKTAYQTYSTLNNIVRTGSTQSPTGSEVAASQGDGSYLKLTTSETTSAGFIGPCRSGLLSDIFSGEAVCATKKAAGDSLFNDTDIGVVIKIPSLAAGATKTIVFDYGLSNPIRPSIQSVNGQVAVAITPTQALSAPDLGTSVTYTATPDLPPGLLLNANTGVVSGTPLYGQVKTAYTLTGTSGSKQAKVSLNIAVEGPLLTPPSQTISGRAMTAIRATTAITPAAFPGTVTYSVSPTLPAGLSLNAATGVISGTPTTEQAATNYLITGTSGSTLATTRVSITIAPPPPSLSPTSQTVNGTVGQPLAATQAMTPIGTSGPVTYLISPALPTGLSMNTSTGVISGTPTAAKATSRYAIYGQFTASGGTRQTNSSLLQLTISAASAAASVTPATVTVTGQVGQALTPTVAPTASGFTGAVSYSVSPSLPAGLSLNTSTGVISGTPTTAQTASAYTLSASGAPSASATIAVTIAVTAAPSLTPGTQSPFTGTVGSAITATSALTPSNFGSAVSVSISPTLPGGLSLDSSTGVISGTPLQASVSTAYTLTGRDTGGLEATSTLSFSINPTLSPATQTVSATQNLPLTPTTALTASGFSTAPSYTVSPSLPAGLSLNTATGVISGTPTAVQSATTHTVTATGGGLTATATLDLTVSALTTPNLSPNPQALTGTPGSALTPSAAYTGATAATFSIQPPLPEGLSLNSTTGVISGTPTGFSPAGGVLADWYNNNFSTTDLKGASVSGDASRTTSCFLIIFCGDPWIELTPAANNKSGAFTVLGNTGSGINAQAYRTQFNLIVGNASGADGVSYSFTDNPEGAPTLNGEVGAGTRLSISFDLYSSAGSPRGIRVLYGPNKANDPSSSVGTDGVLAYSSNMTWAGADKPIVVQIDVLGRLTLSVDSVVIFNQLQLPADYLTADRSSWQHVFKARTGASNSQQGLDELVIQQSGPGAAQYTVTATNATGSGTAAVTLAVGALPAAPTNLAATIPGAGQATISFTPPAGPGFGYQYSLDGTTWLAANVFNNAFTLSGLSGQTTIQLRAVNSAGPGPSASILVGTPSAPTALTATPGNGQASISFTPGADGGSPITNYQYSINNGAWTSAGSFTSPLVISGLTNATAYSIELRGVNALGNGTASTAVSVTPVADPPGIPGTVVAVANSGTSTVALSWSAPDTGGSAITGYTVEMTTNPPSNYAVPTGCAGTNLGRSCTATGLGAGTYFFRVQASNVAGSGGYGYTANGATIANIRPNAPTALVATPASQQASIAFVAPTQTFNGGAISLYPVMDYEYSLNGTTWTSAGTATSPVTIDGLNNGTPYTIYLRAINAAGAGTASSSVGVTPATAPSAPTITSATALTGGSLGQVSIAFTAGANGGSALSNYEYNLNGGAWTARSPTATTSPLTLSSGLTKGVNAVIGLRAVNGVGVGPADTVSVVPLGVPDAPTDASAVAASTQATVSWTPPDNTGGAKIIDYTVTSSPGNRTCTTSSTGCSVTGLTNGTAYTFTVKARNTYGNSIASTASGSVSPGAVPGAPQAVTATAGNAQASVSWSVPTSNTPATTSYTVVADQDASKTCTIAAPTLTCNVTGLTNGTAYSFSVTATNGLGTGAAGTSGSVTPTTTPGTPTLLSVTGGNASATLVWMAPASEGGTPITGYSVQANSSSVAGCTSLSASATSCQATGLTNGSTYAFTVAAINVRGTGSYSTPQSATPMAPSLAPVSQTVNGVLGTAITPTLALTPSNFSGSVTYTASSLPGGLYLDSTTGVISGTPTSTQASAATTITGTGTSGTATTTVSISVAAAVPSSPLGVGATAGNARATINWFAPSDDGGASIIDYTVTSIPSGGTCTASAPATTCSVTGLTNDTGYTFTVTARNSSGSSAPSAASASVTPIAPALSPTTLTVAGTVNQPISPTQAPLATGFGGTVTYSIAPALPTGFTLDTSAGIIQGTSTTALSATSYTLTGTAGSDTATLSVTLSVGRADQSTLNLVASPTTIKVNGTSDLSTTGGTGTGAVSYTVQSGPCGVSGTSLTGNGAGSCVVTATKAQDAGYSAVSSLPVTVTVGLAPQSKLSASANPTTILVNGVSSLSSIGGSGTGSVSYQVVSGPCSISGASLTGTGPGSCKVTVSKAADTVYASETSEALTVTVDRAPQSELKVQANPTTVDVNATSTLSTTGGSGTGAVSFAVAKGPCTIIDTTLTGISPGVCQVVATKSQDNTYAEATSEPLTVTVVLAPQTALLLSASPSTLEGGGSTALSTTGGSGVGFVSYQLLSGPCTLDSNLLVGLEAGSCVVKATKAEDSVYIEAVSEPLTVTVGLAPQSELTAVASSASMSVNGTSGLSSQGGSGTGSMTYQLLSGPCSLSGSTLTGLAKGSCAVTATKAADSIYAAATSKALIVLVDLSAQAPLNAVATPSSVAVNQNGSLSVSGGSSSGGVTYQLLSGPCSLSGSTVIGLAVGSCSITATQAADSTYSAVVSSPITVEVGLASQSTLTVSANPNSILANDVSSLTSNGGSGIGVLSYVLTSGPCSLNGNQLTGLAEGNCVVGAVKASDPTYAETSALPITVHVGPGPSVTPQFQSVVASVGQPMTPTPPMVPALLGNSVSYQVNPELPSGLSIDPVTGVISGTPLSEQFAQTYTIYAIGGASSASFASILSFVTSSSETPMAMATIRIGVEPGSLTSQVITFGSEPSPVYTPNGTFTESATASSGLTVTFSSLSPAVCSTNGGATVSILNAGNCVIAANQAGNGQWAAAPEAQQTIYIFPATQAPLVLTATPSQISTFGTSVLSTTGGSGLGNVVYTVALGDPCSVNDNILTGLGTGVCNVTATKEASNNYLEATDTVTVSVDLAPQATLVLSASPTSINVNGTSTLSTSGGSGTGIVTYAVVSGPCSVSSSTLTGTGVGSCSVTATKPADSTYTAVTSDPVVVTVGLAPQAALVLSASPTSVNVNGTSTLSTSGGSGTGIVTYAVVSGPCSVSSNTLTGTGVGSCSVTATKAADSTYAAETSAPVVVTVGLAPQATLTLTPSATSVQTGQSVTLSTTGGSGDGAVTYSAVAQPNANPQTANSQSATTASVLTCGISGNILTPTGGAGSCLVTATKAGNGPYAEATAQSTITVTTPPPPPNPIPTLGEWAKIVMMLMMIGAVGWQTRRVMQRR
jgi:hypothetical protein